MRSRLVSGSLLIVLGLLFLALNRWHVGGEIVIALLGSAFLVWFAYAEQYGLLIPGAVLTGLGLGVVWETAAPSDGAAVLFGLASGFLGIFIIDRLMGNRRPGGWWPLVPAGVMFIVGLIVVIEGSLLWAVISRWWPVVFILVGLWLSSAAGRRPKPPTEQS